MTSYYDIYFVFQIFSYLKFPRSNKYFLPRYLTTEYDICMYIQYNVLIKCWVRCPGYDQSDLHTSIKYCKNMESWVGAKYLVYNEYILFRNLQKRFLAYQELDTLQTRYPLWSGFPYYNVTTSLGKAPQSDTWERTQQLYGFQPCMRTFTGTQFMTKKHTYTFVGTLLQKLYSFILVPTHSWQVRGLSV